MKMTLEETKEVLTEIQCCNTNLSEKQINALTVAIDLINEDSTIAEPIKHGCWETWGWVFHGIKWKRCSLCHKIADVSYSALIEGEIKMATSAICGCCGARMDVIYQDDKIRAIKVT